jgi:hypothetical protein
MRDEDVRFRGMTASVGSGFVVVPRLNGNDTNAFNVGARRADVLGLERLFTFRFASSCANKPPRGGFASMATSDTSTFGCAFIVMIELGENTTLLTVSFLIAFLA